MKIKRGKYTFGLLAMLFFTACASQNQFEWVKINPDKINLSKTREPQSNIVRQVNLVLALKEKEKVTYYSEPNGFFAEQNNVEAESFKSPLQKNIAKSYKSTKKIRQTSKPQPKEKANAKAKVVDKREIKVNSSSADKLNNALKIPLNSKALKSKKNVASFGSNSSEIREMAFNDIKKKNPEIEKRSEEKEKRGKNLMWAGLILVIIGSVMGFIFGRSAFLIALAGLVFAGIGYFFRV